MSPQPFDVLAQRLSIAERQLVIACEEIAVLRRDVSGHRRSRWMANAFAIIGVVAAVMLARSPDPQAQKSQGAASSVVKAPFVVVDENSKTLFRVDVAPGSNRARVAVGDPIGMHVHLGPNVEGGATVAIMNNATDGNVYLEGSLKNSDIVIKNKARAISLNANTEIATLQILNGSGNSVITLRGQDNGYFELGNEAGKRMVSAGTNPDHVGQVFAQGPGGGSTSGSPTSFSKPLSIIKGWK